VEDDLENKMDDKLKKKKRKTTKKNTKLKKWKMTSKKMEDEPINQNQPNWL
jgi:hypothetical protein